MPDGVFLHRRTKENCFVTSVQPHKPLAGELRRDIGEPLHGARLRRNTDELHMLALEHWNVVAVSILFSTAVGQTPNLTLITMA